MPWCNAVATPPALLYSRPVSPPAHDTVAAVVPCYNAGDRVLPVVDALTRHTPCVIVVDDGCSDGCLDDAAKLPVQIVRHDRNRGKGHAILTGFREALKDVDVGAVAVLDADGQHNPDDLPRFVEQMNADNAGLAIGARTFTRGYVPLRSRFGNLVTVGVTALLLGARLPDTQCGFRLHSRRFAQFVVDHVAGGRYETEMEIIVAAVRAGFRVSSVPIATVYEQGNASSHFRKVSDSIRIYSRLFRCVWRHRRLVE